MANRTHYNIKSSDLIKLSEFSAEIKTLQRSFALFKQDISDILRRIEAIISNGDRY